MIILLASPLSILTSKYTLFVTKPCGSCSSVTGFFSLVLLTLIMLMIVMFIMMMMLLMIYLEKTSSGSITVPINAIPNNEPILIYDHFDDDGGGGVEEQNRK